MKILVILCLCLKSIGSVPIFIEGSRLVLLRAGAPKGSGHNMIKATFESGRLHAHNFIKGNYHFYPPIRESMIGYTRLLVKIDGNKKWKLLNSTRFYPCHDILDPNGPLHIWKQKFTPDLPETCPVTGKYRIDTTIPIHREKWDPVLQILIPKFVLQGDKYRLDFAFYYKNGLLGGLFSVEFKLFPPEKDTREEILVKNIHDVFFNPGHHPYRKHLIDNGNVTVGNSTKIN
uniref:CSON015548 protein n=1 Tax=Culicoides sonorensis TaxID=179676 RepID=A0A336MD87_CULSO